MSTIRDLLIAMQADPDLSAPGRLALIAVSQYSTDGVVTRPVDRAMVQEIVGISNYDAEWGIDELHARGLVITDEYGTWATCFPEWELQWVATVRAAHPTTRQYIPLAVRLAVYARDEYRCVECGANEPLSIDHVIPISKGGLTVYENLQTLCVHHNNLKGSA